MSVEITPASLELFRSFAEDAPNWSGMPPAWVSRQERGNLTQLKKAGLLQTSPPDEQGDAWIFFTKAGVEFAREQGIDLSMVEF